MADPDSIEGWLALVSQHEAVARTMAANKIAAAQGWWHAGIAVECALKAYIMWKERLNAWPSREARGDLFTHDVRALSLIAGLTVGPTNPIAASWHLVFQWDRNQGYDPKPMPRKVARSMVEAVFGIDGVVTWIRSSLT